AASSRATPAWIVLPPGRLSPGCAADTDPTRRIARQRQLAGRRDGAAAAACPGRRARRDWAATAPRRDWAAQPFGPSDERRAAIEERLVGLRGGRAIRRLGDDLGLDPVGVAVRDLVLERGRDQDVAIDLQHVGVGDVLGSGETLDSAVLLLPGNHPVDVEPLR